MYLFNLVKQGRLSREGGARGQSWSTFLSRSEVEAAETLGVTSQTVRNRLPTFQPKRARLLVRRADVVNREEK